MQNTFSGKLNRTYQIDLDYQYINKCANLEKSINLSPSENIYFTWAPCSDVSQYLHFLSSPQNYM